MDENSIKLRIGKKLKKYRKQLNLTQFKLGEEIEIDQRQIAMIERGKSFPSLRTFIKLCNVFKCDISAFFIEEQQDIDTKKLQNEIISTIKNTENKKLNIIKSFLMFIDGFGVDE